MSAFADSAHTSSVDGVLDKLVEILEDMIQDWGVELDQPLGAGTSLMDDLGFASIDLVALIAAIDDEWQRRDWPYEQLLMEDGRYVEDLTAGEISEFLWRQGAR